MAKFHGALGFSVTRETAPGVYTEETIPRIYSGDLIRNTRTLQSSGNLNENINISNQISVLGDPFAYENFHSLRYAEFMGAKWKIESVDVQYPRLILTIGGVYND